MIKCILEISLHRRGLHMPSTYILALVGSRLSLIDDMDDAINLEQKIRMAQPSSAVLSQILTAGMGPLSINGRDQASSYKHGGVQAAELSQTLHQSAKVPVTQGQRTVRSMVPPSSYPRKHAAWYVRQDTMRTARRTGTNAPGSSHSMRLDEVSLCNLLPAPWEAWKIAHPTSAGSSLSSSRPPYWSRSGLVMACHGSQLPRSTSSK